MRGPDRYKCGAGALAPYVLFSATFRLLAMSFYMGVAINMWCMENFQKNQKNCLSECGAPMCEGTQYGPTAGTLGRLTDSLHSDVFVGGGQPPAYSGCPLHMAKMF